MRNEPSASPTFIVIGYTNIDVNITPKSKTILPGGGAYFAAIAASRYVNTVGLVTRVGYDYDTHFLLKRVLAEGVHIDATKPTARSTQTYHSEVDLTDRTISLEWGVAPDINPSDIPSDWLKSVTHIHVATMPPKQQYEFITYIRGNAPEVQLSIDSDSFFFDDQIKKEQIKTNYAAADLVFVNRVEYESLKEFLNTLPRVIVKQDKDGVFYLVRGKKKFGFPAPQVEIKDATGAGDVLAGTCMALLSMGKSLEDALSEACKVASHSVEQEGVMHLFTDNSQGAL